MKKAPDADRIRKCNHCSSVFYDKPSRRRVYCCMACRREAMRAFSKTATCPACGGQFTTVEKKQVHCSKKCSWAATKGPEFNAHVAKVSAEKRGMAQRGRGEGRAYRKFMGRHEHRVVAEAAIGRALAPGEVVHHKDGNKLNNSPDNLEVTTQREHMQKHGMGIPGVAPSHKPWEKRKRSIAK